MCCDTNQGRNWTSMSFIPLILTLVWPLIQGQPILEPLKEEFIVSAGSSWEISCKGQKPLEWDYPGNNGNGPMIQNTSNRTFINHVKDVQGFKSTLRLEKAHYLDTGYYLCKYTNTSEYPNVSINTCVNKYLNNSIHIFRLLPPMGPA